jgi:hypothetical protein
VAATPYPAYGFFAVFLPGGGYALPGLRVLCGLFAGWRLRLTRPTVLCGLFVGWRLRLTRPTGSLRSFCRVAAAPYPTYGFFAVFLPGGGCALPGLRVLYGLFVGWLLRLTRPTGSVLSFCRVAATGSVGCFVGPVSAAPPGVLSRTAPTNTEILIQLRF